MNGRAEVGLPGVLLGVSVLLAILSPVLLPNELAVISPLEGPDVAAPTAAVSLVAVILAGASVLLARRWARLAHSRRPASFAVAQAHALAWAAALLLAWPLVTGAATWAVANLGVVPWGLGLLTGWAATRHRPKLTPQAVQPPGRPGDAVAWTGHARLSADVAAPLLVFLLLVAGPPFANLLHTDGPTRLGLLATWLLVLLAYAAQLRALWVTVTIGANGIRIRTGPFGRVVHHDWDQIGAVEVLHEELPADSVLWARRFGRRYVLRPGPALRIREPQRHRPAITVSVDDAHQAVAIATRHLIEHAHHHE